MIRFNAISLRSISRCIPAINWTSDKPDVCLCFNSDVSLLNRFFITRSFVWFYYLFRATHPKFQGGSYEGKRRNGGQLQNMGGFLDHQMHIDRNRWSGLT